MLRASKAPSARSSLYFVFLVFFLWYVTHSTDSGPPLHSLIHTTSFYFGPYTNIFSLYFNFWGALGGKPQTCALWIHCLSMKCSDCHYLSTEFVSFSFRVERVVVEPCQQRSTLGSQLLSQYIKFGFADQLYSFFLLTEDFFLCCCAIGTRLLVPWLRFPLLQIRDFPLTFIIITRQIILMLYLSRPKWDEVYQHRGPQERGAV